MKNELKFEKKGIFYLYVFAILLIIIGAIIKITHSWGGGTILFLAGITIGSIAGILDAWGKPQKTLSRTSKILLYIAASLVIVGAILKIAHIGASMNFLMLWVGCALGSGVYLVEFQKSKSQK